MHLSQARFTQDLALPDSFDALEESVFLMHVAVNPGIVQRADTEIPSDFAYYADRRAGLKRGYDFRIVSRFVPDKGIFDNFEISQIGGPPFVRRFECSSGAF